MKKLFAMFLALAMLLTMVGSCAVAEEKIHLTGMCWGSTAQYEQLVADVLATNPELAEKYETEVLIMTGFLDGINESLKGYENPIDTMEEDTEVKIEIDPEKLYYNMVEAKATWLYELPQWDNLLDEAKRKELYKKQKASGTVRREGHKIYPNDPCPCGSGKKYKKCCGKNA